MLQHGKIAGIVESGKEVEGSESPTQESRGSWGAPLYLAKGG